MRKIIGLVVMLLVSLVIVACGNTTIELDTPTNVVINNGIVTWDAVENAEEYRVIVGTDSHTVTTTTFNLNTLDLVAGTYQVTVVAVSGDTISLPSSTASYVVQSVDPTDPGITINVYAEVLAIIDETYVPGMLEDDFEDEWYYRDYQRNSTLANTYTQATNARNMSKENAVGFFAHIFNMAQSMSMMDSMGNMMNALDAISDFDMTTADFAYVVVELGMVAMTITMEDLADDILNYEDQLDVLEADLTIALSNAQFVAIYDALETYTTMETLPYLDAFFMATDYDYYYISNEITNMANQLLYNYEFHDQNYYLMHDEPMITAFYNILLNAKQANNTTLLGDLTSYYNNPFMPVNHVYNLNQQIQYYNEDILSAQENIVRLGELVAYFTLEKAMMRQTIQDVADYVVTVYNSITPALVLLLDDAIAGEYGPSMEEIFLIKNEVVTILHTTLPSAEYFSDMYYTMFHIANALGDFDLVDFYDYTVFLGDLAHAEFDLLLTFVAVVNQTAVEDVMALVDGMYIPGEEIYDPISGNYYHTPDTYDFEKVIGLAVYVGTFMEDFKLANAAKFTAVETLLGDAAVEELLLLFGDFVKQVMALEMNEEELQFAEFIVDEMLADYDNIVAGLGVVYGIGIDLISEFLTTEGQMFLDLYQLTQTDMEVINRAVVTEIESVFAQMVDYNSIIAINLTQPEIEKLLKIVRVPLMVQMMMNDETFNKEDFNLLFAELVTPISTVMANFVNLENQMLTVITAMDVATLVFDSSWNISEQHALMGIIIFALDDLFTTANETLFFDTIAIIGDDILSNSSIMGMMGTTQLEVDDMIDGLVTHFQGVFADAHLIAGYDFTALTAGQILEIETFFQSLFAIFPQDEPIPE